MKKYGFTLFFVLIALCLFAQRPANSKRKSDSKDEQRWKELEFNSIFLFQEIFGVDRENDLEQSYLLGYKMGRGNVGLRMGIGAGFNLRQEKQSLLDERKTREYLIRGRLGIEWRKQLSDHWLLIAGVDALVEANYRKDASITSFDEFEKISREIQFGGGPLVGIRYQINDRIALATETAIHAFYIKSVTEEKSKKFPEDFNEKEVVLEYPVRIAPPINLYLILRL